MERIYQVRDPANPSNLNDIGLEKNQSIHDGAGGSYVFAGSLCATTITGVMRSFGTTDTSSSGYQVATNLKFPIGCKIFRSKTAIPSTVPYYEHAFDFTCMDLDLSLSYPMSSNPFENDENYRIYMSVEINFTNGIPTSWSPAYPEKEYLFKDEGNLVAGREYIFIGYGRTYDQTYWNICSLEVNNDLFHYDGTNLIDWATYISSVNSGSSYTAGSGIDITNNVISEVGAVEDVSTNSKSLSPRKVYSFTSTTMTNLSITLDNSGSGLLLYHFYIGVRSVDTVMTMTTNTGVVSFKPSSFTSTTLDAAKFYEFSVLISNGVARVLVSTWT